MEKDILTRKMQKKKQKNYDLTVFSEIFWG